MGLKKQEALEWVRDNKIATLFIFIAFILAVGLALSNISYNRANTSLSARHRKDRLKIKTDSIKILADSSTIKNLKDSIANTDKDHRKSIALLEEKNHSLAVDTDRLNGLYVHALSQRDSLQKLLTAARQKPVNKPSQRRRVTRANHSCSCGVHPYYGN